MRRLGTISIITLCLVFAFTVLTACGDSEAKTEMKSAVNAANELLEQGDEPYNLATQEDLERAIAHADEAKDDSEYSEVTREIADAQKAYEDSVAQLKQVTNPDEAFLIERAKTVETITEVEAATEETDSNQMLHKEGSYTSYIAMKSSLVKDEFGFYKDQTPVEAGTDGGAVIEAFANEEDAKAREEYLASFDGGVLSSGSHTVVGTLLVRTSSELTATEQKELEQKIIEALIRLED